MTARRLTITSWLTAASCMFAAAFVAAMASTSPALADAASETVIAATHAGLAAKGADLKTVHMHLHHTVNCLVGPDGKGFDAKQLNPCANSGKGAIPDTADAAKAKALDAAAEKAMAGIAATDLATAQKDATETEDMLKAIK